MRTMGLGLVLGLGLVVPVAAPARQAAAPPSFDAATIKPAADITAPGGGRPIAFDVEPNRLTVVNLSLGTLIEKAYQLLDYQMTAAGPLQTALQARYDIAAVAAEPVPAATIRLMLQDLLARRFHLAVHWDTRSGPMYNLVVLPTGAKMQAAEHGYAAANSPMSNGHGVITLGWGPMSMPQLAAQLTLFAGRPVVDATQLDGYFTVKLSFMRSDFVEPPGSDAPVETAPLLADALQQQLGLKLEAATAPIKVLVVDHADAAPSGN